MGRSLIVLEEDLPSHGRRRTDDRAISWKRACSWFACLGVASCPCLRTLFERLAKTVSGLGYPHPSYPGTGVEVGRRPPGVNASENGCVKFYRILNFSLGWASASFRHARTLFLYNQRRDSANPLKIAHAQEPRPA